MTSLQATFLITSSTAIGLKSGFFCNGINMLTVKALTGCVDCSSSDQRFFVKFVKALRRSLDEFPHCLEVNILHQPSASRPGVSFC